MIEIQHKCTYTYCIVCDAYFQDIFQKQGIEVPKVAVPPTAALNQQFKTHDGELELF